MKNITVFTVLVIILCSIFPLTADEAPQYAFSVTPQAGFFFGQADEIVYSSPGDSYYSGMISKLVWDIAGIFYYGMILDFSAAEQMRQRGFFSSLSLKYAVPGSSGSITNSDWMSPVNNKLTHYSHHDNYLDGILHVDCAAGYSLPFLSHFMVKAQLALSYMRYGFSALHGTGKYARGISSGEYLPINDNPQRYTFLGKVLSYSQNWLIFSAGIGFGVQILDNFLIEAGISISPLVMSANLDFHCPVYALIGDSRVPELSGRNMQFADYLWGGFLYEPGIKLRYACNQWISVSLEASYRSISGTRGAAYKRQMNDSHFSEAGEAGAGLRLLVTGLSLTVRL